MKTQLVVALLVGLLGAVAVAYAEDGTPNLGTAQINQVDSRWFIEARHFDAGGTLGEWQDNQTYSIGFSTPVNEKTEFGMMYASSKILTNEGLGSMRTDRKVLSPWLKYRINGLEKNWALTLSLGSDIALEDATTRLGTTIVAKDDDFTPAARLQLEFGKGVRWQLAAQGALWDNPRITNASPAVEGYDTLISVGGGLVWPVSSKLCLAGDVMVPVDGDNYFDVDTRQVDTEPVWSAGLSWKISPATNTTLSVFATNAWGPTLAESIIASPENAVGFGATLRRDF